MANVKTIITDDMDRGITTYIVIIGESVHSIWRSEEKAKKILENENLRAWSSRITILPVKMETVPTNISTWLDDALILQNSEYNRYPASRGIVGEPQ